MNFMARRTIRLPKGSDLREYALYTYLGARSIYARSSSTDQRKERTTS